MVQLLRRQVLGAGAIAGVTSLAGCFGLFDHEPETIWLPAQPDWVPVAHFDLSVTRKTSDLDPVLPLLLPSTESAEPTSFVPDFPPTEDIDDPLLRFPIAASGRVIGVSLLALAAAGLGHLVDADDPTREVTELFVAGDVIVGIGEIDVERAEESLRTSSEGVFGDIVFSSAEDIGEYTVYEPAADDGGIVAVDESAVIAAETRAAVRTAIEARRGDRDRLANMNETAAWLFDTAGIGDMSIGWLGSVDLGQYYWEDGPVTDILHDRENLVASLSFVPEDQEIVASLAVEESELEATADSLESRLGSEAADSSVSIDGNRLSASGTYTNDALDIDFLEPSEPSDETTVPSGEDVPASVRAAVANGEFTFEHQSENNLVQVNFSGEIDADEVTVRALPSEDEASTTTPGPVNYLNVMAAPDDEAVVVIVTVDGESGIVARTDLE